MCTVTLEFNQSNALARRKLTALLATGLFVQKDFQPEEPTPEQVQAHRELRDAALEHSRKNDVSYHCPLPMKYHQRDIVEVSFLFPDGTFKPHPAIIVSNDQLQEDRERLGHYLSTLSELLRGAVKAVIDYIQSGYRSFSYRQECDVKRYMNSQSDKEEAAGIVLNASLPFLKSDEHERVKGQLSYIVQDMKEEHLQSQGRGLHM